MAMQGGRGIMSRGTSYDKYRGKNPASGLSSLFDMPLAQSIVKHVLNDQLSSLVLSFLEPLRRQSYMSQLHFCTHLRQGNNEQGDWARKTNRHIDLEYILNATLQSMESVAREWENGTAASKVSVFVASDTTRARGWFRENVPINWKIVKPGKKLPRPEQGVWFGQHGSGTNKVLNQTQKDDVMAEAMSDVFALGECDALWIPNYSTFTVISIVKMRAEKRMVLFWNSKENTYIKFPYLNE